MEGNFRNRFLMVTGPHPYSWAAQYGVPKHVISSILAGNYAPQKKTLDMLKRKAGLSTEWLKLGVGEPYLHENDDTEVRISVSDTRMHDSGDITRTYRIEKDGRTQIFMHKIRSKNSAQVNQESHTEKSSSDTSQKPSEFAVNQEADRYVRSEEVESGNVAGTIAAGSAEVDEAKLALAARVLEEWTAEKGLVVKPERKGAIIAILYKMLMKGAQQKDMETLLRAGNGG